MIKVIKNKKIKNPAFYDYGYHITSKENIPSIMNYGLKPNETYSSNIGVGPSEGLYPKYSIEIADWLYNGKIPLYFLTTPSLNYISSKFRVVIKYDKRSLVMLKVDVSKFDQLPDVDFLRMSDQEFQYYKAGPKRNIPAIDFSTSGNISL